MVLRGTQCKLPPPSPVPWLVLPDRRIISFPRGDTLQLPDDVRCHTSCGEWLVLSREDDSRFLLNPFTKATMLLPSLSSFSYYEQPVEVTEDDMVLDIGTWMDNKDKGRVYVVSLGVCSTRLIAAIVAVGGLCAIALCRPGAAVWSVSAHEKCRCLSQIVFFQGKLYALDYKINGNHEGLIAIDIVDEHDSDEPRVSRIERLIVREHLRYQLRPTGKHYLLEYLRSLVLVCRKVSYNREIGNRFVGSSKFELFEANFEQHLWAEVRTLGNDQALFLGKGCSRAVCVSPYDLSRDCIFFMDDYTDWCSKKITTFCRVYDMKDKNLYSPLPMVPWEFGKFPAVWVFSQGETDKSETAGVDLHKSVKTEEVDPLMLIGGGTCSADASTTPY